MNAQLGTFKRITTFAGLALVLVALVFFINTGVASAKGLGLHDPLLVGIGTERINGMSFQGGADAGRLGAVSIEKFGTGFRFEGNIGRLGEIQRMGLGNTFVLTTVEPFHIGMEKFGGRSNVVLGEGWKALP